MSVERRLCDECEAGLHGHRGKCGGQGALVFSTSGGPVERPNVCGCESEGNPNPDTQQEMSFANATG